MSAPDRIFAKGTLHPHPGMEGHVVVFASVVQTSGTVEYLRATPELLALIEAAKFHAAHPGAHTMSAHNLIEAVTKAICGTDPWDCYIHEAQAAIDAINSSGTHVVAPVEVFEDAADTIESWGAYAGEYFQKRHDLAGDAARFRAMIQAIPKVTP